jgi:LysR family nitrogen assimilation transcriptional regulator
MVDTGSLTRAAHVLGIAQPALSQQLAAMEASFGAKLLTRTRQGVAPTPAGRSLYRHAQIILKQLDQARVEVKHAYDEASGVVHVGLPLTAATVLAVPLLKATQARFPDISLHLVDGVSGGLLAELTTNGRLDIGILPGKLGGNGLTAQPLMTERLVLVSSRDSPMGKSDAPVRLAELQGYPLVLPEVNNRIRHAIDAGFAQIGVQPKIVAQMNSIFSLCAAAQANLGSAVMPWAGAAAVQQGLSIRPLIDPEIERPTYLAVSDVAPLLPASVAIYALIIEVTSDLITSGKWPGARLVLQASP